MPNAPVLTGKGQGDCVAACDQLTTDNPEMLAYVRARGRAEVLTLLHSGVRISDMVKLERKAVDLRSGKMLLRVMKARVPLYVHLHSDAVEALQLCRSTGHTSSGPD